MANVRALSYCNVFSLSVEHFNSVLLHYPVMRRTMETVANERMDKMVKDGRRKSSELPRINSRLFDVNADINIVHETMNQRFPSNKRLNVDNYGFRRLPKSASDCNFIKFKNVLD